MGKLINVYVDYSKKFTIYNRSSDGDLRCMTIKMGKVVNEVSLTLSSYDRILYLSRLNKYKDIFFFD